LQNREKVTKVILAEQLTCCIRKMNANVKIGENMSIIVK